MRRIAKTCTLSTVYKTWHDELETSARAHPKYNSSSHQYYWDIVMNLFHCQKGLCAYTEMTLCTPTLFEAHKWVKGRYVIVDDEKPPIRGQLEHFDSRLKDNRGWLWSNFFMVDSDTNTKVKNIRSVDDILKPDSPDYDPFTKLQYNLATHLFIPHTSLDAPIKSRIKDMLVTLGINYEPVRDLRRQYLMPKLKEIKFGIATWKTAEIEQFPTAFEMVRQSGESLP